MGGYGSGGHNVKKSSTGYYPRIDSFWFNKIIPIMNEKEIEQKESDMEWSNGARIKTIIFQDKIIVNYGYRTNDYDEWKYVNEEIYFSKTSNNYGGNRLYFICPYCHNSFRFLYIRNGYFRCRNCNKLNYPMSRKGKNDIPAIKMQTILNNKFKINTKDLSYMDMADYVPIRPKGMHWITYYKWLEKLEEAQSEYNKMVIRVCYSFGIRYL